ncbi:serine/threonine-protein kinase [Nocardioides gansuensis]|uniref:serine/threonine-protein kinase n=1 Tax=Nocardioides gansuensis TaxID=2138300 RepID=UPI000E300F18|nr:serine/threonine-protein kinase [Nocardioides gansuensis]
MPTPAKLGRYPVRRRLGAGAFATVWLAYDNHLDSAVAIKVLADNWSGDLHIRRRFVEEGRFLRKVESPHVVPVYDAGELPDGRPYLVMAYADEGTLADRLELSRLTPEEALHVICQVGTGLHALHQRGVLHRDVKPANVLFRTGSGGELVAMLGDLGLGKAMDMSSRLTVVGGTPSFVAPEQARGEGLDPRADLYSLAALSYLLLSGHRPYDHPSLGAAAEPQPPRPMTEAAPGSVSDEVDAVVRRALSPVREDRYADVPSYLSALTRATGSTATTAPQPWQAAAPGPPSQGTSAEPAAGATLHRGPSVQQRRSRPQLVVGAGLVALLLGAVGGALAESLRDGDREVVDAAGHIRVTVPEGWERVEVEGWKVPTGDGARVDQPALSVGESAGWQTTGTASGVFVGLLPGTGLPDVVPQHPECDSARPPIDDKQDGDRSRTVFFSDCVGGTVTVERVVQATVNQLMWVQVRSADRTTANRVLDSVELSGI